MKKRFESILLSKRFCNYVRFFSKANKTTATIETDAKTSKTIQKADMFFSDGWKAELSSLLVSAARLTVIVYNSFVPSSAVHSIVTMLSSPTLYVAGSLIFTEQPELSGWHRKDNSP